MTTNFRKLALDNPCIAGSNMRVPIEERKTNLSHKFMRALVLSATVAVGSPLRLDLGRPQMSLTVRCERFRQVSVARGVIGTFLCLGLMVLFLGILPFPLYA